MTEYLERQGKRDDNLIYRLAGRADDLREYYSKWIHEEIKSLQTPLIELAEKHKDTIIGTHLKFTIQRLEQISSSDLPQHLEYVEENCSALKGGATDNLIDDIYQLEDGINYLRGLVYELLKIRKRACELSGIDRGE